MKDKRSDHIDILGPRKERSQAFSRAMLSEIDDETLSNIVKQAAQNLSTPIALVNFILEEIQFFKAHYGLPPDLQSIRATDRDVSFCQYVVRDEDILEVNDAQNDPRIPQYLVKEYGLKSYLGVPIVANNFVIGSLCVIDLEPRTFSTKEREDLLSLATLVNQRLNEISEPSTYSGLSLIEISIAPALKDMLNSLLPILSETSSCYVILAELKSFIRKAEFALKEVFPYPKAIKDALIQATSAADMLEDHIYNIEMSSVDVNDIVDALSKGFTQSSTTTLEDIVMSGRELARANSRMIGGVYLPEIDYNPVLLTPRPLGVSLISTCISMISAKLLDIKTTSRIIIDVQDKGFFALVSLASARLTNQDLKEIVLQLNHYLGNEPTIKIEVKEDTIGLFFSVQMFR